MQLNWWTQTDDRSLPSHRINHCVQTFFSANGEAIMIFISRKWFYRYQMHRLASAMCCLYGLSYLCSIPKWQNRKKKVCWFSKLIKDKYAVVVVGFSSSFFLVGSCWFAGEKEPVWVNQVAQKVSIFVGKTSSGIRTQRPHRWGICHHQVIAFSPESRGEVWLYRQHPHFLR